MIRIACLHTAQSNVSVFEAALQASGSADVSLHHVVRADLLAAAERDGALTVEIIARTVAALRGLCEQADAVLLTCSTLGPAAEVAAEGAAVPIMRVDAALAAQAVGGGGKVVVLCAVETTLGPTKALFERAARATGADIVVRLVPRAWEAFRAGDGERYLDLIAQACRQAWRDGAAQVALAQASMAGAARLLPANQRPLDSPRAGLAAAVAAASRT